MSEGGCGARHRRCGPGGAHWRGYSLSESVAAAAAAPPADVEGAMLGAARLVAAAARAANDVPPAAVAALPHVDAARRHVKSAALERLFARRGGRAALVGRQGDAEHRAAARARMDRAVALLHGAARAADIALVAASAAVAMSFGGAGAPASVAAVVSVVDRHASIGRARRFYRRAAPAAAGPRGAQAPVASAAAGPRALGLNAVILPGTLALAIEEAPQ